MNLKRTLTLVLALLMVLALFAGCGSSETTSNEPADQTEAPAAADDSAAPAADPAEPAAVPTIEPAAPAAESAEEAAPGDSFLNDAGEVEYALPLTEDEATITVWAPMTQAFQKYLEEYSEIETVKKIMADTNVELIFQSPASDQKNAQFMTMVAGGDYPDVLSDVNTLYSTGLTGACDDEVIIDLTELQSELAPAYTAMVADLGCGKDVVDDAGHSYLFAKLMKDGQQLTTGLAARKDWMDEMGVDALVTYDDWHEYLSYIKSEHNATMWATQNGQLSYNYLSAGFGTKMFVFANPGSTAPFIVEDGVVNWGPAKKEAGMDYLTMMNQWYNEGLIYEEFLSVFAPFTADVTPLTSSKVGLAVIIAGQFDGLAGMADDPGFELWPVQDAAKDADTVNTFEDDSSSAGGVNSGYSISTSCEDPEFVTRFFDYLYSRQGYETLYYGVEGQDFEYVNGEPNYTDAVLNNSDPTHNYDWYTNAYFGGNSFGGAAAYGAVINAYEGARAAAVDLWHIHNGSNSYPTNATMTAEESSDYAVAYAEVQTYAATRITEMIVADHAPTEEEYDEFLQTCIDLGLEDCIAYKQAAYDRYINR